MLCFNFWIKCVPLPPLPSEYQCYSWQESGSGPVHMVYSQEKKGQVSGINSPLARRAVGVSSR